MEKKHRTAGNESDKSFEQSSERGPGTRSEALELKVRALKRLEEIVEQLRGPDGCPWDREQTLESLSHNFLEEACEVLDAVAGAGGEGGASSSPEVREELGDLLMNIFLAARIAEELGGFNLAEVADGICRKLIRRHPHVFGEEKISDADGVLSRWRAIKKEEKAGKSPGSVLDGVPKSLPALQVAFELGRKAAQLGFDWPESGGALTKVREELKELEECLKRPEAPAPQALRHEIGDLLLAVVNFSRKVQVSPEAALREAAWRFRRRFRYMEERISETKAREGKAPTLEEMERLWQEAKRLE